MQPVAKVSSKYKRIHGLNTWVYQKREYRCRNECDGDNFTFEIQGRNLSGNGLMCNFKG